MLQYDIFLKPITWLTHLIQIVFRASPNERSMLFVKSNTGSVLLGCPYQIPWYLVSSCFCVSPLQFFVIIIHDGFAHFITFSICMFITFEVTFNMRMGDAMYAGRCYCVLDQNWEVILFVLTSMGGSYLFTIQNSYFSKHLNSKILVAVTYLAAMPLFHIYTEICIFWDKKLIFVICPHPLIKYLGIWVLSALKPWLKSSPYIA